MIAGLIEWPCFHGMQLLVLSQTLHDVAALFCDMGVARVVRVFCNLSIGSTFRFRDRLCRTRM